MMRWRLTPNNVVTIFILIAALIAGWYRFDNRLSLAEERMAVGVAAARDERAQISQRLARVELERDSSRDRLTRVEVRLDQISAQNEHIVKRLEQFGSQNEQMARIMREIADRLNASGPHPRVH